MSEIEVNEARESRIKMEVVVDAYDETKRAIGWYHYLEDRLDFPFMAEWMSYSGNMPVEVTVVAMSPEDDCSSDMLVKVELQEGTFKDVFNLPLVELQLMEGNSRTNTAMSDWHYWKARGYGF